MPVFRSVANAGSAWLTAAWSAPAAASTVACASALALVITLLIWSVTPESNEPTGSPGLQPASPKGAVTSTDTVNNNASGRLRRIIGAPRVRTLPQLHQRYPVTGRAPTTVGKTGSTVKTRLTWRNSCVVGKIVRAYGRRRRRLATRWPGHPRRAKRRLAEAARSDRPADQLSGQAPGGPSWPIRPSRRSARGSSARSG